MPLLCKPKLHQHKSPTATWPITTAARRVTPQRAFTARTWAAGNPKQKGKNGISAVFSFLSLFTRYGVYFRNFLGHHFKTDAVLGGAVPLRL